MADQLQQVAQDKAWLISRSGGQAGLRYSVSQETTRVGRAPDNDVVVQGPDAASVSLHHFEIHRAEQAYRIRDLESTNGTFLNGERISEAELPAQAHIRLGTQGPEFEFGLGEPESAPAELSSTQVIPENVVPSEAAKAAEPVSGTYEGLLSEAVERARHARARGISGETMTIMREALDHALRRTGRRFRVVIIALVVGLLAVSGAAAWKITQLSHEKSAIDRRIHDTEAQLQQARTHSEADRLATELDAYQQQAERLQENLLYRAVGPRQRDPVTEELRGLMGEFGSEVYSIPPEFTDRVNHYIQQYQGSDHALMEAALGEAAPRLGVVKRVLEEEHLPPDLAYVPLVESALGHEQSAAGAAGLWQFTPATAKAFGLRVDAQVDERTNPVKATRAACRYLRNLILDFGSGSSVMLALAAYNLGPGRVKQAIAKTVEDPIKQRNFWYLYRTRSLPVETREYVPKVMAAILIGRNPKRFGF